MPPPLIPTAPARGDRNKSLSLEITCWVLSSIALVTVILRLYGRLRITRNLGWNDFRVIIAMIANLIFSGFAEAGIKDGFGRHPYYLSLEKTSKAIKWILIAFIPGIMSLSIVKLSVIILLTNLLNPPKYQKYFMYFLSCSCIVSACVIAALVWQQCKPTASLWNPLLVPAARCWIPVVILNISITQGHDTSDLLIWTSVKSCFIIIAADIATLRPVVLHLTGRDGTARSGSSFAKNSRRSYRMDYMSNSSNARGKRGPKDPYPIETVARYESEEHIVPSNGSRKNDDVEVNDSSKVVESVSEEYMYRVTRSATSSRY